ncbi:transcriptional activator RfaH [bacterium]|nr:transcriptional activator RfaH [bacterium]
MAPVAIGIREAGRVMAAAWYVVETQRHRELVARAVLADRGITSYLPRVRQWPRPAVGSAVAPLFPGYLFVRVAFGEQGHQVLRSNGVKAFVAFGGEPVPVRDEVVAFLQTREGADGVIRCGEPSGGAAVRIVDGPFRGLTAVVTERLAAGDRVRVLMELLQRQTSVELPERWVRRL